MMTDKKYSPAMFDAIVKAIANEDNWQYANGTMELKWSFVDADVSQFCGPGVGDPRSEWAEHYKQYDAACAAVEAARGVAYPTKLRFSFENRN